MVWRENDLRLKNYQMMTQILTIKVMQPEKQLKFEDPCAKTGARLTVLSRKKASLKNSRKAIQWA